MEDDEIIEWKKSNHTPAIILGIVAISFIVFGAISYKKFVNEKFEQKLKEHKLNQNINSSSPDSRKNEVEAHTKINTSDTSSTNIEDDLSKLKSDLEKAKKELQRSKKYKNIPKIYGPLSENNDKNNLNQQKLTTEIAIKKMKEDIIKSPSLAKVIEYNKDWGFVIINSGYNNGIKKDTRFAVRRNDIIVGWIKIDKIQDEISYGNLITNNKYSDISKKPQKGDDIIVFETNSTLKKLNNNGF